MKAAHVLACVAAALLVPTPEAAQAPALPLDGRILLGAKVQVSTAHPQSDYNEHLIAASGHDARRLVVCAKRWEAGVPMDTPGRTHVTAFVSQDGGATWQATLEVHGSDPACTFGADGSAYVTNLPLDERVLELHRSTDAGLTWVGPVKLPYIDREYLVADTTGGPGRGRLYLHGTMYGRVLEEARGDQREERLASAVAFLASSDNGLSFAGPRLRVSVPPRVVFTTGNAVVLSDGTLAAIVGERDSRAATPDATLWLLKSPAGLPDPPAAIAIARRTRISEIPVLAADPGSARFKDRLYAVWVARRLGPESSAEIVVVSSADRGRTWSEPVAINEGRQRNAVRTYLRVPRVAVNRDGVVGVAWHESDAVGAPGWVGKVIAGRELFRVSLDGGATWLPPVLLSSEATATGNDTEGLTADARGVFHAGWTERDLQTERVRLWTAPIRVSP